MLETQPKTRQRQLALMTQLNNMTFDMKRSMNEQLGKFDEVVREYERISGSTYPEHLHVSQCGPGPLAGAVAHVALGGHDVQKEKVLAYERSTTKWHATSGMQFPAVTTSDTATPMEIDAVTYAAAIEGQEGRREGEEGQGQGPRQQREEQGRKAQRREAEPKKGGRPTGKCHTCGKQGHFSRDCWRNRPGGKGVRQVQEETASSPSSTATTVAALTQQPVHPTAKAVTRIKMSTPPTAATTEIFDISEHRCRLRPGACRPIYFVQMVTAVTATTNEDPQMEEEPALIILDSGGPVLFRSARQPS